MHHCLPHSLGGWGRGWDGGQRHLSALCWDMELDDVKDKASSLPLSYSSVSSSLGSRLLGTQISWAHLGWARLEDPLW